MSEVTRYRLTLAYCGTGWQGWQRQPQADTLQGSLESALSRLLKLPIQVQGASRTDAGVHALGQVAHFDVPHPLPHDLDQLRRGCNAILLGSLRVLTWQVATPDFDACRSASGKIYRYRIGREPELDPFLADRLWHLPGPLDLPTLRAAAALLVGTHNFVRLSANRGDCSEQARRLDLVGSTRTLHRAEVLELAGELEIEFEGDAFLYRMVRMMVGSMLHVARGRDPLAWLQELISSPAGLQSHQTAPAAGLYLVQVNYPSSTV